jgi:hypothetical protein
MFGLDLDRISELGLGAVRPKYFNLLGDLDFSGKEVNLARHGVASMPILNYERCVSREKFEHARRQSDYSES